MEYCYSCKFPIEGCFGKLTFHYLESKNVTECDTITNLLRREYFAMFILQCCEKSP